MGKNLLLLMFSLLVSQNVFAGVSYHLYGASAEVLYKNTKFTSAETTGSIRNKMLLDKTTRLVLMCTFDADIAKQSKSNSHIDQNLIYTCLVNQGEIGLDDTGVISK